MSEKKKKRIGKSAIVVKTRLEKVEEMHRQDIYTLADQASKAARNVAEGKPGGVRLDQMASVVTFGAGRIAGLREAYEALAPKEEEKGLNTTEPEEGEGKQDG